jgi:segregation and condensation protein A
LSDQIDNWDAEEIRGSADPRLTIDIEGFEGPLDLLLELARRQKVDLVRISILALAEQYLAYIESAQRLRIEIAADYLVMAAWLAYLKSRLLLPEPELDADEPSGEEMAAMLAFRLQRLEAMRQAGARMMNRNRLGRDFFARGQPEATIVEKRVAYSATLYDLLDAYAAQRQKKLGQHVTIARREVWSLAEARDLLLRFGLGSTDWATLESFLIRYLPNIGEHPEKRATMRASSFAAALELVREGRLAMRQERAYAPLYLRAASRKDAKSDERV